MSVNKPRQHDLTVLGATGFTGNLTARYIAENLPTDVRWAIAGRSEAKLNKVAQEIKALNPNRPQPSIEVVNLNLDELSLLAKKTKVILNTIGPYHKYSTPVVEACAKTGTHYLDVTGELPWTMDMIEQYHTTAQKSKAILISQAGVESAPSDLISFSLAKFIKETLNADTGAVVATIHEMKGTPSGGTLSTIFTIMDSYPLSTLQRRHQGNWASSPVAHPNFTNPPAPASSSQSILGKTLLSRLTGVVNFPDLGILTVQPMGNVNRGIVQRSWGLLDSGKYYGPNFSYNEHLSVRNRLVGMLFYLGLTIGMIAVAIPPIRALLSRLVTAPGQGPTERAAKEESLELRAVAQVDDRSGRRAMGSFRYKGGMYNLTAAILVEAGMILAKNEELVGRLGGGYLTPAMLGQHLIDRLKKNSGVDLDVDIM